MRGKVILSIILALALLLSGCTGGRGETKGGELVRLGDEPTTLDPHLTGDVDSAIIVVEVFGGLVTLDRNMKVVPDLAESWKVSNDGKTYTFTLRSDAKFHSGKPVTARDFKWSIERAADPKTQSTTVDTYLGDIVGIREKLRGAAKEVSGVRVVDDSTLELTIDAPKAYFLAKLTYPTAFVLDQANVEASREWFKKPNGTGPFKLKEYLSSERIVLEANPEYHLGAPRLDSVRFILSGGTPMVMYENNEIHITGVGLNDLDRVRDPASPLSKELQVAPPSFQTSYVGFSVTKPPFDDIKVRQALSHAINKDEIASKVLQERVKPAYGILPPGFPAFNPELKGLRFDPQKAKKLLAESKYGPDPAKLPRMVLTVPGALGTAVGPDLEAVLAAWRDILGLNVEVQQVEFATFLQDLRGYRLQMFVLGWVADYPDPQNFLDLLFHSKSLNNETRYSNLEVDRLLEQARTERDEKTRFGLYQKAEELIVTDASWIPLWYPGEGYVLIKPRVKDYLLLPLIVPRYRFVYLEK
ncbi:MAG: peptide ABC transporter substrate-binding protein [Chloroflexota bacterium]